MLLQAQVAPLLRLLQGVEQGCVHPFRGAGVQAQAPGNLVGGEKADPGHLTQPVGMAPQDIHGLLSKGLVDLHRPVGCDPVGDQKGHHVPGAPVGQVGLLDLFQLPRTDTGDGQQPFRFFVQNAESVHAKGLEKSSPPSWSQCP